VTRSISMPARGWAVR